MKYFKVILLICLPLIISQCKFEQIDQPANVQPGEILEISITIYDDIVPEPNPHKGVLCILIPEDWSYISCEYSSTLGNGNMVFAPNWADSAEACYPASAMGDNMKWIAMISDSGYAYDNPITIDIDVNLQAGQTEGCFELAYLITKATGDLLCTGWSPLSYPHNIGVPDSCYSDKKYEAEPAPEWDALLDTDSGWTGADGIYTIPLSGSEVPAELNSETTLILFSDTFIGEVDSTGHRQNAKLVNNTYAIFKGIHPVQDQISFYWETDNSNQPMTVFVPETPNSNVGDWYWLMDGIYIHDKVYVFALRLKEGSGGIFNFEVVGVSLISFTLDSTNAISDCKQVDTPLFYTDETKSFQIILGQAVMPMTAQSGNPNPDGYIYIYGPRNTSSKKELIAARVLPEDIEDFSQWSYWDSHNWSTEISNCAKITDGISQEFSVSPIDDEQFILVYQTGNHVAIRFGESPTGPFDFYEIIYNCPEVENDPNIFVYNAKAHPHLSNYRELLISYNVNTFSFWDLFSNADIYRPRFITLELDESNTSINTDNESQSIQSFSLLQNYPNPFNPTTTIKFVLDEQANVVFNIYNMLGQHVKTLLIGEFSSGQHSVFWDGKNDLGKKISSGIYIYQIRVNDKIENKKMLLLR